MRNVSAICGLPFPVSMFPSPTSFPPDPFFLYSLLLLGLQVPLLIPRLLLLLLLLLFLFLFNSLSFLFSCFSCFSSSSVSSVLSFPPTLSSYFCSFSMFCYSFFCSVPSPSSLPFPVSSVPSSTPSLFLLF